MYKYMFVYIFFCVFSIWVIYICTCLCPSLSVHRYIHIYVYVYVYLSVSVYIYISIHADSHKYTPSLFLKLDAILCFCFFQSLAYGSSACALRRTELIEGLDEQEVLQGVQSLGQGSLPGRIETILDHESALGAVRGPIRDYPGLLGHSRLPGLFV